MSVSSSALEVLREQLHQLAPNLEVTHKDLADGTLCLLFRHSVDAGMLAGCFCHALPVILPLAGVIRFVEPPVVEYLAILQQWERTAVGRPL